MTSSVHAEGNLMCVEFAATDVTIKPYKPSELACQSVRCFQRTHCSDTTDTMAASVTFGNEQTGTRHSRERKDLDTYRNCMFRSEDNELCTEYKEVQSATFTSSCFGKRWTSSLSAVVSDTSTDQAAPETETELSVHCVVVGRSL